VHFNARTPRLLPADGPNTGTELIIVEGDSAAAAVNAVREPRSQAVLAMQGKPLNALRASAGKVAGFALYTLLADTLGVAIVDAQSTKPAPAGPRPEAEPLSGCRYARVLLLFDADADGIHCGALMLMFFYRWMRPLLASGRIELIHPPMFELRFAQNAAAGRRQARNEPEAARLAGELRGAGIDPIHTYRYRGLGNIDPAVLRETCTAPATRAGRAVGLADARVVIDVWGAARQGAA
jgi:DNA gyrase subunit B